MDTKDNIDKQLRYFGIKENDDIITRWSKISIKSFSFYTLLFLILSFLFNLHSKIKLFFIILAILNSIFGTIIARRYINKIKKITGFHNDTMLLLFERIFHIGIVLIIFFIYKLPKIETFDIFLSTISCFVILNIYALLFKEEIVYMKSMSTNKAYFIYTLIFFITYSIVYFYNKV